MDRYQYLLLMGACVLITLPLELYFGSRVWRQPRRLAIALLPAFALFVACLCRNSLAMRTYSYTDVV